MAFKERTIAVIGYGSQGRAQALNMRDSGMNVIVGLRKGGKSWPIAEKDGFDILTPGEAAKNAGVILMLTQDDVQPKIYKDEIEPHLKKGIALAFSHGFNIHYGQIIPPKEVDVYMVAPKSPGDLLRRMFMQGKGVPCLLAIHQDPSGKAKEIALGHAKAIGGTRAGVIETTFEEETESDLIGEQIVLCGGVTHLIKAGFEALVEAGYQPEVSYFECLNELKLIVDLIYERGISGMRKNVSDTAKFGDITRGPRIITDETRKEMRKIIHEVQSGEFAKEWILENKVGRPVFNALLKKEEQHFIEKVGNQLRSMMPWLNE